MPVIIHQTLSLGLSEPWRCFSQLPSCFPLPMATWSRLQGTAVIAGPGRAKPHTVPGTTMGSVHRGVHPCPPGPQQHMVHCSSTSRTQKVCYVERFSLRPGARMRLPVYLRENFSSSNRHCSRINRNCSLAQYVSLNIVSVSQEHKVEGSRGAVIPEHPCS